MIITKREFIMRFLDVLRQKLEDTLTPEPMFEHEFHEEALTVLRKEVNP